MEKISVHLLSVRTFGVYPLLVRVCLVFVIVSISGCRTSDPYTFPRHCIDSGDSQIQVYSGDNRDGSTSSIRGYVRAPLTHGSLQYEWLAGAAVRIDSVYIAADRLGMFEYTGIAPGVYEIEVQFVGTETAKTRIDIEEGEDVVIVATLCLGGGIWSPAY
ncbi:MAG: carboxypeptidase-like regulatory domain-containing protein [Balneolales bacterium]|nr:carboxypeptidase-like regulatory domain-containing protein [Balneolales bacterium]